MRSMPRNAWVIQITPVRLTRTTANDASVVRNIYLSIDPIVPYSPQLTTERAACNHPEAGSPNGCAAYRPAGLVSHYHPVDPSTKWPRDGTPCPMVNNSPAVAGRPRQAWQRCAGQVIVPDGAASATNDDVPTAFSTGFDPAIALTFWRICPCPTPSRSASSRCPHPPA